MSIATPNDSPGRKEAAGPPAEAPGEAARLRVPPPAYALLLALLAWGAQTVFDCPALVPYPWKLAGLVPGAAGLALVLWSLSCFRGRRTTIHPFGRPSALVLDGPYRLTRNPMYVSLTLALLGLAVLVGSLPFFFAPPLFVLVMNSIQIPHEERLLARLFGEEWDAYRRRVRRWL